MKEIRLSGVEWGVLELVFKLQRTDLIPFYPWDVMKTDEPKRRHYDQAFGGEWEVLEQPFSFEWNTDKPERVVTLTLLMRGEIPLEGDRKQMTSLEAQRRWFVETLKIEKTVSETSIQVGSDKYDGKFEGEFRRKEIIEAHSHDDIMRMLEAGVK